MMFSPLQLVDSEGMRKETGSLTFRLLLISLVLGNLVSITLSSALPKINLDEVPGPSIFKETKLVSSDKPVFQKGMSYVARSSNAFSSSDSDKSLALLTKTNTEWVAICVFWYQSNISSYDIHADPERTPTIESVAHAIDRAHDLGMKVMLKPMIDLLETEGVRPWPAWRGEILPSDEWFESYANFINHFAGLAEQNDVDLFCVGCELKETTHAKQHWENIISGVRERYSGPITYAADWSSYQRIAWWSSLDYIGIDAYFPLTILRYDPTLEEIKNAWVSYANDLENWHSTINKPIIFTEIGYRSGDGTNMAPGNYWIEMRVDFQEQVDCYEAAFQTLWNKSWFYGFYWWNWETDPNAGGSNDADYTPQNKPAQDVITNWYSLPRRVILIDQTFVSVDRCGVHESQSIGFHASWEDNETPVVGASVYVNGTEHVTDETGWVSFNASYETVGKRVWTITSVHHPSGTCYKKTVDDPHIIWDKIEMTEIDRDTITQGILKVRVKVIYAYDKTPVTGATTAVNGVPCVEIELGIYSSEIPSWNPYQTIEIHAEFPNFARTTTTTSTVHIMNLILHLAFFVVGILMTFLLVRRYCKYSKSGR